MTDGTDLRARRAEALRAELRAAFVRLAAEKGIDAVPLAEVAEAAGVSERTLYRHYANREALLDAVREFDAVAFDERLARGSDRYRLEDPEMLARVFAVFEEHVDLLRISRALRLSGEDLGGSQDRSDQLRAVLAPHVHPDALDQAVGLGRLLAGSDAWLRLREPDIGLDPRSAGHAVQWALQVILQAAGEVDGPLVPEPASPLAIDPEEDGDDGRDAD